LRMHGEGVATIRPLDEQRHAPDGEGCDGSEVECPRAEDEPEQAISKDDEKRGRMRRQRAEPRGPVHRRGRAHCRRFPAAHGPETLLKIVRPSTSSTRKMMTKM